MKHLTSSLVPVVSLSLGLWATISCCTSAQAQNAPTSEPPKRPFSVSASLREEYDDNIFTASQNPDASLKTIITPSILFNYPMDQSKFSARYTLGATAYVDRDKTLDISHEFLTRYTHSFSDRFSLDFRNRFSYAQEPEINNGATVARIDGNYLNNTFTTQGTMQWTPKFGTVTTFTDDYLAYEAATQKVNDRLQNSLTHDFRYLILPTTTVVLGGTYTNLNYLKKVSVAGADRSRDWQSLSPYAGVDYAITPQIMLSPRAGITYTTYDDRSVGDQVTPYGAFNVDWKIGERSSASFNYTYTVAPTDLTAYSSQDQHLLSLTGRYQVTPLILSKATIFYSASQDRGNTSFAAGQGDTNESTLGLDLGGSYEYNKSFSFETGYIFNKISSDLANRAYERNRLYMGLRYNY